MLLTAADFYMRQNQEPQKVLNYSAKLVAAVNARNRPDGVADADWQKYRAHYIGLGQWMTGVTDCAQGKYEDSNKALRESLPLIEGSNELKAAALFNLGIANSHLRNVSDAGRFFEAVRRPGDPVPSQMRRKPQGDSIGLSRRQIALWMACLCLRSSRHRT